MAVVTEAIKNATNSPIQRGQFYWYLVPEEGTGKLVYVVHPDAKTHTEFDGNEREVEVIQFVDRFDGVCKTTITVGPNSNSLFLLENVAVEPEIRTLASYENPVVYKDGDLCMFSSSGLGFLIKNGEDIRCEKIGTSTMTANSHQYPDKILGRFGFTIKTYDPDGIRAPQTLYPRN